MSGAPLPRATGSTPARDPGTSQAPAPPTVTSPIDVLLGQVQSSLALRRRGVVERVQELGAALASYQRAVEERIAVEFARDHQLKAPAGTGVEARAAALRLRDLVSALPELASEPPGEAATDAPRPTRAEVHVGEVHRAEVHRAEVRGAEVHRVEVRGAETTSLPRLTRQASGRKVVIVGSLAGRQRGDAIPAELQAQVEWVDTEGGGAHAIGNLPQRIRQGRVAALVLLDRAVQHKHTEPLVSAARASNVPFGFAGKGGAASIRRALEAIEEQLAGDA